jgi:hypothetical protein
MNTITIKGLKLLRDEALEDKKYTLSKVYEKHLGELTTKENIHQSIIERFQSNQIQSVCIGGKTFNSLKEYLEYHEKNN